MPTFFTPSWQPPVGVRCPPQGLGDSKGRFGKVKLDWIRPGQVRLHKYESKIISSANQRISNPIRIACLTYLRLG
jgi:hypothetical protein